MNALMAVVRSKMNYVHFYSLLKKMDRKSIMANSALIEPFATLKSKMKI